MLGGGMQLGQANGGGALRADDDYAGDHDGELEPRYGSAGDECVLERRSCAGGEGDPEGTEEGAGSGGDVSSGGRRVELVRPLDEGADVNNPELQARLPWVGQRWMAKDNQAVVASNPSGLVRPDGSGGLRQDDASNRTRRLCDGGPGPALLVEAEGGGGAVRDRRADLGTGGGNKETVLPLWKGFETFGIAHGASTQVMLATRKIVQA